MHIEGTNGDAVNVYQYNPARGAGYEKAWFLLKPVTETVSGRVEAGADAVHGVEGGVLNSAVGSSQNVGRVDHNTVGSYHGHSDLIAVQVATTT